MSARAIVAHQMPGRVRFSVPDKRGDVDYFQRLSRRFSGIDSVHRVKANPLAGSIVLEFAGALEALLLRLAAPDLFELAESLVGNDNLAPPPYPIQLVSGRDINPMFMAGVGFAVLGLLQGFRGRVMVPAVTAFWYATSTFQQAGVAVALSEEGDSE
jgi:hypothetical protein